MVSVIVLGTGNVGTHLINTFLNCTSIDLVQIYGRTTSSLSIFEDKVATTTNVSNLKKADVYIIAISDDSISQFSSRLTGKEKLIVHTSGSLSINALKNEGHKGVFYPLQTFSKQSKIDFNTIPICIEADNDKDLKVLKKLANCISNKVNVIDSEQRKYLHIAAVFSNNFVNYLYKIANDICDKNNIPFEILQSLIVETTQKIATNYPSEIQTGPAIRNDTKIIEEHLKLLSGEQKIIYQLITKSIQKTNGEKL